MFRRVKISDLKWIFIQRIILFITPFLLVSTNNTKAENTEKSSNPAPVQIKLTAAMLVDEVPGKSYWSPSYLVDEQACNPENDIHPFSRSWKPYFNMDKGQYSVYIDLGEEYELTKIALHEMGGNQNLVIQTGEPGDWNYLYTEPCSEFNVWVEQETTVKTRYLRLSMKEGVFAQVNEIVIYGIKTGQQIPITQSGMADIPNGSLLDLEDVSNIIDPSISLGGSFMNDIIYVNIPDESDHEFTIDIYNLNGLKVYHKEFIYNVSTRILVNVANECAQSGVYILKYYNKSGVTGTLKFIKRD